MWRSWWIQKVSHDETPLNDNHIQLKHALALQEQSRRDDIPVGTTQTKLKLIDQEKVKNQMRKIELTK